MDALVPLFYRNWDTEELINLPRSAQPVNRRTEPWMAANHVLTQHIYLPQHMNRTSELRAKTRSFNKFYIKVPKTRSL